MYECEAVAWVEHFSHPRGAPTPRAPFTARTVLQSGDNLSHRVGVRAIVKPYVIRCKFDFENNIGEVQAKRR